MKIRTVAIATAALALIPSMLFAQTAPVKPAKPAKMSLMQRLHMMKMTPPAQKTALAKATPTTGKMGTASIPAGSLIGDKKTKVFHLAGDKNLPNINNRVYFKTAAEAQAAGFRQAGMTGKTKSTMAKGKSSKKMMAH